MRKARERYQVLYMTASRPGDAHEIARSDRLDDAFHTAVRACENPSSYAPDVIDVLIDDTRSGMVMWWLHDRDREPVCRWV